LLEVLDKETKQLTRAFESAQKPRRSPDDQDRRRSNWLPTIKGHGDEIEKSLEGSGQAEVNERESLHRAQSKGCARFIFTHL
jgi:hypothetical protein